MTTTSYQQTDNTSDEMKKIFDKSYNMEISFPSNQIDAIYGFFIKRGFHEQAAKSISITLLNQAREDNVNVFQLLDKLKVLTDEQLMNIITDVVNVYRNKTSVIGYKVTNTDETLESRNIIV